MERILDAIPLDDDQREKIQNMNRHVEFEIEEFPEDISAFDLDLAISLGQYSTLFIKWGDERLAGVISSLKPNGIMLSTQIASSLYAVRVRSERYWEENRLFEKPESKTFDPIDAYGQCMLLPWDHNMAGNMIDIQNEAQKLSVYPILSELIGGHYLEISDIIIEDAA